MARSEDPTTYSQAWQDGQPGYAPHDPYAQQPQSGYGTPPQQPAVPDSSGYAQQTHGYEQLAQDPGVTGAQVQQEAYPTLDPQPAGYAPAPEPGYATANPYASVDHTAQPAVQGYQPAQGYQEQGQLEAAPQAYQEVAHQGYQTAPQTYEPAPVQPTGYSYADQAAQPTQGYAADAHGQPEAHSYQPQAYEAQTYAEPTQSYATAESQVQPQTYAEYAPAAQIGEPAYAPTQDPYGQPAQYAEVQSQHGAESFGHHDPMAGGAGSGYGQAVQHQEPTLGAAPSQTYQDFGAQPQFADPQPHAHDLGQAQYGGQDAGVLDTSMFTQPGDLTQSGTLAGTASAGMVQAGGHDYGFQTQPAAGHAEFGQQGIDPQTGFDQRFQQQPHGYDQRFEQPVQGQYDGGLVGDITPQLGQEPSFDMAPVVAEQQVETPRSRRGLIVVGALVAAVGIGGGLGFAYKYSNDGAQGLAETPPTIKANRTAAKQAPKAVAGQNSYSSDTFAKRLETNRAASTSTTRVVSREEPLAGNGTSGVSLRTSTSGQTNADGTRVTNLQGSANRAKVAGVRRVKTLKVNPDGSFAVPSSNTGGSNSDTLSISGVSLGSIPKASAPKARATVKAKRIDVAKAVQAARKKTATLPKLAAKVPKPRPAATPKAVARLQPASTTAASGGSLGYVVQVSARRSRIDALAAFADLQQRYTGALSAKQPDIQEVNLGATRGKWYRVRIGPPGSKNAAYNLCNRLKKSGLKDCLIKAY